MISTSALTLRQMLNMATTFWHKESGFEIQAKSKKSKVYYIVKISDSEALTHDLDFMPISIANEEIKFQKVEYAFAAIQAYIAKKGNEDV